MQELIGRKSVHSDFAPEDDTDWKLPGHEGFQSLLERGLEVKAHWTHERFWWRRVLYVPSGAAPLALFVETSKHAPRDPRHRVAFAEIEGVRMAVGEIRTIEILRGGDGRNRTLSIEFPTRRAAELFQEHLAGLLGAMGIAGGQVSGQQLGAGVSDCHAQSSSPEGLTGRVAAQGYSRNGNS